MGFAGVYRAVYDYTPQAEGELAIEENDILYILENNADDGWWKAKKKAGTEDEDEPIGLVPGNYVEQVCWRTLGFWVLIFPTSISPVSLACSIPTCSESVC